MYDWLTENKLPLGRGMKFLMDLLTGHARGFFDAVSWLLGAFIDGMTGLLLAAPPVVAIVVTAAGAFALHRSISLAVFVLVSLGLVVNLGYWEATMQTLSLVLSSTFVCVLAGVPLGIAAAHRPWFYKLLRPVLDFAEVWFERAGAITFHDPLAAAAIFDDAICGFERGRVEVELKSDHLAGATVWYPNDPKGHHEVATTVDAPKFFEHYFKFF